MNFAYAIAIGLLWVVQVTDTGDLVTPLDAPNRRPYERLLIARTRNSCAQPTSTPCSSRGESHEEIGKDSQLNTHSTCAEVPNDLVMVRACQPRVCSDVRTCRVFREISDSVLVEVVVIVRILCMFVLLIQFDLPFSPSVLVVRDNDTFILSVLGLSVCTRYPLQERTLGNQS